MQISFLFIGQESTRGEVNIVESEGIIQQY